MPTLVRFLVVLIVLAVIGLAGMFYLANFVEPHTREMTVKVPADRLQPHDSNAPALAAEPSPAPAGAAPAPAPAGPAPAAPGPAPAQPSKPPKPLND
jgi:hypothetical protein